MSVAHLKIHSIKDWSEDDKPREKLLNKGPHSLSNAELLAILLGTGTKKYNAIQLAQQILKKFDNDFTKLSKCQFKDLTSFDGIGPAKAVTLLSVMEIFRRKVFISPTKEPLNSPKSIYEHMKYFLMGKTREEFWVILLNNRYNCIDTIQLSKGGLVATNVDIRVIMKEALHHNALNIILVHNHPSKNSTPSQKDLIITKKIKNASRTLDINLADHLIFCDDGYFSFRENELL